jgi:2-polyprenyl-6-hydroxyphenyl methylase / 3-demethylubiquinone-9 3-methyltransferase
MPGTTVSPAEIARFDALAARWWDPHGPMRPLHRMNPVRVAWIAERVSVPPPWPGLARRSTSCLQAPGEDVDGRAKPGHEGTMGTVRLLDVGCGAGVAAEALARRGFEVLGLDASAAAIEAGRAHAKGQHLPLTYQVGAAEDLLGEPARFPVITALEVIEHVPEPAAFVATLAALLAPGGKLFLSTLNRTPQSFLAAKVGAEYLLRWLPVGTHDWRRFVTPAELGALLRQAGLRVTDVAGLVADPLTGRWSTSRNVSVNYLLAAAS